MPHKSTDVSLPAPRAARRSTSRRPFRVLVVDPQPQSRQLLAQCGRRGEAMEVLAAATLAEAWARLAEGPVDLAVIEPALPDGSGLAFAHELRRRRRRTQTLMVTEHPSLEAAVEAIRAGATDFLIKPLDLADLNGRVRQAMARREHDKQQAERIRRLRRSCKKLNQARVDVGRQVDILCNDLVTAYQELASQMQEVASTREYEVMIRQELDLEQLLRKTLEYLIDKVGPTNAAIFLPSTADEFTVGGYVNYDCADGAADLLLQHLGDVVAPRIAEQERPVLIADDDTLSQWMGEDAAHLAGSDVVAFGCRHEDEPLAVVMLFRDRAEPFDPTTPEMCAAVGPILGRTLVKIIQIHHRHLTGLGEDAFDEDDEDNPYPF